jgi:hypothetical protein
MGGWITRTHRQLSKHEGRATPDPGMLVGADEAGAGMRILRADHLSARTLG